MASSLPTFEPILVQTGFSCGELLRQTQPVQRNSSLRAALSRVRSLDLGVGQEGAQQQRQDARTVQQDVHLVVERRP